MEMMEREDGLPENAVCKMEEQRNVNIDISQSKNLPAQSWSVIEPALKRKKA